jgi:Cu/Ag efflux protein CusF
MPEPRDREAFVRQMAKAASRAAMGYAEQAGVPFSSATEMAYDALRIALMAHILTMEKDPTKRLEMVSETMMYLATEATRLSGLEQKFDA